MKSQPVNFESIRDIRPETRIGTTETQIRLGRVIDTDTDTHRRSSAHPKKALRIPLAILESQGLGLRVEG
jgi:hypothetical protein